MLGRIGVFVLAGLLVFGGFSCVQDTSHKKAEESLGTGFVKGFAVSQNPAGTQFLIRSDAPIRYTAYSMRSPFRLLVEIPDMSVPPSLMEQPVPGGGLIDRVDLKTLNTKGRQNLFLTLFLKGPVDYDALTTQEGLAFTLKTVSLASALPQTTSLKPEEPTVKPSGETAAQPVPSLEPTPVQVRCEPDRADRLVCRIQSSRRFLEVKSFSLKDPERLVVDLQGVRPLTPLETLAVERPELKTVRIGGHQDKTRVVFEFPIGMLPSTEMEEGADYVLVHFRTPGKPAPETPDSMASIPVKQTERSVPESLPSPRPVTPTREDPEKPSPKAFTSSAGDPARDTAPAAPSSVFIPFAPVSGEPEFEPMDALGANVSILSGKSNTYIGSPITITMRDMDIREFFDFLADHIVKYHPREGRINFILSDNVQGRITMKLIDIPWDQALDMVLEAHRLRKILRTNNVVWITTEDDHNRVQREREQAKLDHIKLIAEQRKAFADRLREERRATAQHELKRAQELNRYSYIPVKYADAEADIKPVLEELLITYYVEIYKDLYGAAEGVEIKPPGSIQVDKRTNTVIVYANPEVIAKCEEVVEKLDQPTKQVLLHARIVEVRSNFERELGIAWGGRYQRFDGANTTGVSGAASTSSTSADTGGAGTSIPNPVVDILPVGTVTGGLGVSFGRIIGASLFELDAQLQALENENKATIISAPKVVALDNSEAVIVQGQQFPLITRDRDNALHAVYRDAALKLIVKPRVVPHSTRITISINLEEKQIVPGSETRNILGNPTLQTKEANTVMLMNSGETMVIGGITSQNKGGAQRRVPCLGNLPGIGYLFKADSKTDEKRELLMFITPTLVEYSPDLEESEPGARKNTGS